MLSKCIKMPKYSFKINLFFFIWGRGLTLRVSCAALHIHIGSARPCILSWKNYVTAKIVHVAANILHVVANILRVTADKAFEEAKCYLPRIFFHFFGIYNGENTLLSKIAKKLLNFFHFQGKNSTFLTLPYRRAMTLQHQFIVVYSLSLSLVYWLGGWRHGH